MTDVVNPKSASPDQLLPYHKKISAEGKALMICFISYTYMVLKRAERYLVREGLPKGKKPSEKRVEDEGRREISERETRRRNPPCFDVMGQRYGELWGSGLICI